MDKLDASEFVEVKIGSDDSGHQYVYPATLHEKFQDLRNNVEETAEYSDEWYDAIDRFTDVFEQYRQRPHNVKLYMKKEDLNDKLTG